MSLAHIVGKSDCLIKINKIKLCLFILDFIGCKYLPFLLVNLVTAKHLHIHEALLCVFWEIEPSISITWGTWLGHGWEHGKDMVGNMVRTWSGHGKDMVIDYWSTLEALCVRLRKSYTYLVN